MTEGRSHHESCRLYDISKHGDIFSASALSRPSPRCIAYVKTLEQFSLTERTVVGFQIGVARRFLLTDGFRHGYPTRRQPGMLVDEEQKTCGSVYVVCHMQNMYLVFETYVGAMTPTVDGIDKFSTHLRYSVTCPSPQENIETEVNSRRCRLAALSYQVSVDSPSGARAFIMEQAMDCSESKKGRRSLAIYDIEREEDLPTALFLARLITLTGYPSNAKPIEVEGGRHE